MHPCPFASLVGDDHRAIADLQESGAVLPDDGDEKSARVIPQGCPRVRGAKGDGLLDHFDPRAGLVEAEVRDSSPASEEDLDGLYDGSACQIGPFVRQGGAAGSI